MSEKIELVSGKSGMIRDKYIGMKFNMLTVVEFDHYKKNSLACFKCKCDCGNYCVARINDLKTGAKKSCGCLGRQNKLDIVKRRKDQTTHGESRTRLYKVWIGMRRRCQPLGNKETKNYGDRGISVCEEWETDFLAFKKWALANGYDENAPKGECTLDRIDVNGNYEPSNCRWANAEVQGRNRRETIYVNFRGEKMTLTEVCHLTSRPYSTTYRRMFEYGMSLEDALFTKPIHGRRLRHA